MNWLSTLAKHVDCLSGRYEAFPVRDESTRASALQVLDKVRRNESAAFVDAEIPYELYALKDTRIDKVIGCIRVTKAQDIAGIAHSREEYHLHKFPPAILSRTQVFTRLVILREYHKTAASLVLFRRLFADALPRGVRAHAAPRAAPV